MCRVVLLGLLAILLSTQMPLPNKVSYLSAHMSPPIIHFWVSDKNPLLGLVRSPPLCKKKKKKSGLRSTDVGSWKILKYLSYLSNEVCIITGGWKLNGILSLNFRLLKGLIYTETKCPLKGAPSRGEQRGRKEIQKLPISFCPRKQKSDKSERIWYILIDFYQLQ